MTATQAPTPGPLTAAIDMLSEARDFIDRFSDVIDGDYGTSEPNAAMVMVHEINATIDHLSAPTAPVEASGEIDELAKKLCQARWPGKSWNVSDLSRAYWRRKAKESLGLTAPVEASGSEREHGPKCWGKTSISDEMMYCYCGSTDSPSGETREALGGQKGDSETLRVLLDNLVIAQTLSKDIRQKATDEARSYLYDLRHTPQPSGETREAVARAALHDADDISGRISKGGYRANLSDVECLRNHVRKLAAALSTTPARAEAQDEGAAWEDVVQWFKPSERTPESGKKFVALHDDGSGAWLGFMHDGGIIDADGDDFSQTLKGVAAWAYLPTGFEFCCEGYPEDPVTLPGHVCPPLYAHPSPTPAAEAKLARAVEGLRQIVHWRVEMTGTPVDTEAANAWAITFDTAATEASQTLSALKSTAAKEGEAE